MKKKQLLVFIMAGSLAAGMSPVTMAFAEADTQTVTIEDTVAVAAESEEGEAAAEPVQCRGLWFIRMPEKITERRGWEFLHI